MGGAESKEEGSPPPRREEPQPQPTQPVNILITKEVSDRWHEIARKSVEAKSDQTQASFVISRGDVDIGGDGDGDAGRVLVVGREEEAEEKPEAVDVVTQTEKEEPADLAEPQEEDGKNEDEPESPPLVSVAELVPESEEISEESKLETVIAEEGEINEEEKGSSDSDRTEMDKLVNMLAQNEAEATKLQDGVAMEGTDRVNVGGEEGEGDDTSTSFIMQTESPSDFLPAGLGPESSSSLMVSDGAYKLPEFEEVNEIEICDTKWHPHPAEEDEQELSLIGELKPGEPMLEDLQKIRVPRAFLPVVIEEDDDGRTTIQTVTAWRIKDRLEAELIKKNEEWTEEMGRLTRKFENSIAEQAEDFERRVEKLVREHPDEVGGWTAPPCSVFATQIGRCYEKNKDDRMKCNELIQKFAHCTNRSIKGEFDMKKRFEFGK